MCLDLVTAPSRLRGGYPAVPRLGLAAALLGDPPVLVLDEPGNGLDPQGIHWLRDLLRERAAAGGTVFVSSHLLAEVEHLADEIVVINHGRLVTTGALSTLQQIGTSVRTDAPDRLTQLLSAAVGTVHSAIEGELVVRGIDIAEIGDRACAAGIALHELAAQAGSLEEPFLAWTQDGATTEDVTAVGPDPRSGRDGTAEDALRLPDVVRRHRPATSSSSSHRRPSPEPSAPSSAPDSRPSSAT